MTTTITDKKLKKAGKHLLTNWVTSDKTVHDLVESWNWNANIFEIYDEVRDWNKHDIKATLKYAYYYFNKDKMINELHSHLVGWGVEDDE